MLQILDETFPIVRSFLAPSIDPLIGQPFGHMMVSLNSFSIAADTIVLIVTSQLRLQRRPPFLQFRGVTNLP